MLSDTDQTPQLPQNAVIGSLLYPLWNNEACNTCKENHYAGRVKKICY